MQVYRVLSARWLHHKVSFHNLNLINAVKFPPYLLFYSIYSPSIPTIDRLYAPPTQLDFIKLPVTSLSRVKVVVGTKTCRSRVCVVVAAALVRRTWRWQGNQSLTVVQHGEQTFLISVYFFHRFIPSTLCRLHGAVVSRRRPRHHRNNFLCLNIYSTPRFFCAASTSVIYLYYCVFESVPLAHNESASKPASFLDGMQGYLPTHTGRKTFLFSVLRACFSFLIPPFPVMVKEKIRHVERGPRKLSPTACRAKAAAPQWMVARTLLLSRKRKSLFFWTTNNTAAGEVNNVFDQYWSVIDVN